MKAEELKSVLYLRRLRDFAKESNRIECIIDEVEDIDHAGRLEVLLANALTLDAVCEFNTAGELRNKPGINVRAGNHIPPPGGPAIEYHLSEIIQGVINGEDPYTIHHEFETLHPFMDGNGRTGRAMWLWQMVNQHNYDMSLGFLHKWYYQSLENPR